MAKENQAMTVSDWEQELTKVWRLALWARDTPEYGEIHLDIDTPNECPYRDQSEASLDLCRSIWKQILVQLQAGRSAEEPLRQLSMAVREMRRAVAEGERLCEIGLAAESARQTYLS